MLFDGKHICVTKTDDNIALLKIDLADSSVNKFNETTLLELAKAIEAVKQSDVIGLILSSGKESFVVGADITEFLGVFERSEDDIMAATAKVNDIFNAIEDLPIPTLTAINGLALGGGCEVALTTDYRVMADTAKIGLPEVKLGIYPGWGGTVRLPRMVGADNAIEWICSGSEKRADAALADGVVDAVVSIDKLLPVSIAMIKRAHAGELNYRARKALKQAKLMLSPMESMMVFETAKGFVKTKAGPHYPSPVEAIKSMQKSATMTREKALLVEASGFAKMAKTSVAQNLIGIFLNDQVLKKKSKSLTKNTAPITQAAVIGAGIMGGGIAYQSASKGVPIIMKDVAQIGLDNGLAEASKLLNKLHERGRMTTEKMATVLNNIVPTLDDASLKAAQVIVEAVVENPKVKQAVLASIEAVTGDNTVLTSNTSTISIDELASALKRPEKFCGMHFFNPVHMMPLVEVIKGAKTSDETIATVVAYAQQIGKSPVVVNDCPGFFVNRVLFPYFGGFSKLIHDGVDFQKIDKVMERFGFPMGPAYLLDVVGIDTAVHANNVMAKGFPDRMQADHPMTMQALFESGRLGQKSNKGFYIYAPDKKGKPTKAYDPHVESLIIKAGATVELSDEDIIARMMIPLCLETLRTLEENIIASPAEADMALVYGIGFPPFRGGVFKYIDEIGTQAFLTLVEKFAALGPLYQPTAGLVEKAKTNQPYYSF